MVDSVGMEEGVGPSGNVFNKLQCRDGCTMKLKASCNGEEHAAKCMFRAVAGYQVHTKINVEAGEGRVLNAFLLVRREAEREWLLMHVFERQVGITGPGVAFEGCKSRG